MFPMIPNGSTHSLAQSFPNFNIKHLGKKRFFAARESGHCSFTQTHKNVKIHLVTHTTNFWKSVILHTLIQKTCVQVRRHCQGYLTEIYWVHYLNTCFTNSQDPNAQLASTPGCQKGEPSRVPSALGGLLALGVPQTSSSKIGGLGMSSESKKGPDEVEQEKKHGFTIWYPNIPVTTIYIV